MTTDDTVHTTATPETRERTEGYTVTGSLGLVCETLPAGERFKVQYLTVHRLIGGWEVCQWIPGQSFPYKVRVGETLHDALWKLARA